MTDESIFAEALGIADPAARAAHLDRACAGNPDLRAAVEALLAAHAAGSPLDRPPESLERTGAYVPAIAAPGDRVGPYKLLEQIGEGGMGEVWVAEQLEPIKRRVALKLIKPGMDSRGVLARFEAERQALALMDHPNIAKVLDAGQTADGRPYFVMELVKGTPITAFCDARKLTPTERLELFVPVCQAIQHAHMKGIIHRDIKPSNVLVALHDEVPIPKVIDFGVAKAVGVQLTDKTVYTGFGTLLGTPAYMAPEQATFNQLDVDTRADVYALGVLLYELLAGSPPLEKERLKRAALDEVLRIVREEEPPRPSQRLSTAETRASIAAVRGTEPDKLSALMKGELDWIVMKALEKDRTRRYESANSFAADVQRYLCGEQVQAVPPSLGYRLRKAYKRNRAAVCVTALFALLVTCSAVIAIGLALIARDAATEARDNERKAQGAEQAARDAEQAARDEQAKTQQANQQLERVADLQRRTRYAAEMNLLQAAYTAGNLSEVGRLLDAQRPKSGEPDLRGFEWHYWNRKLNGHIRELRIPNEQTGDKSRLSPTTASLSADGSFIVLGKLDSDGRIKLSSRSTIDGRVIKQAELPAAGAKKDGTPATRYSVLSGLSTSPDGRYVFVTLQGGDPEAFGPYQRVDEFAWELATGKVTKLEGAETFVENEEKFDGFPIEATEDTEKSVAAITSFRPDGEYLVVVRVPMPGAGGLAETTQGTLACWKRGEKKPLWTRDTTIHQQYREDTCIRFLGKGERFARLDISPTRTKISILETATGKVLDTFPSLPVSTPSESRVIARGRTGQFDDLVRVSRDGRWLAIAARGGAVVADLERSSQSESDRGLLKPPHLVTKVIESVRGVGTSIGLRDDGSELVTFDSGQGDELVVRAWAIKGDPAFEPAKPFPFYSYLCPAGQFAVLSTERDFGKPPEANAQYPLRVYSYTGDLLFEAPFTAVNVGSRGFAFTTRSGRHLIGVPGQGWKLVKGFQPGAGRPEYKGPTDSSPVIVWDLTAKKEVARSKPEPGLSVLAADVDEVNGRLAVAYVPIPKMIGPGGVRGGFGNGPAVISTIKVYSFPAMQWLQDLPLPKDSQLWGELRFNPDTGEWATQVGGVGPANFREARWTARTGDYRGLTEIPEIDRVWKETSNGKQILQVVTVPGGAKYVIRDKSGALASEIPVISGQYRNRYFPGRLSPDGTRLLTLSEPPKLYDVATGRELLTLQREEQRTADPQYLNPMQDGLWSADGTQFWYAVDSKGKLVCFDARPLPEPKP